MRNETTGLVEPGERRCGPAGSGVAAHSSRPRSDLATTAPASTYRGGPMTRKRLSRSLVVLAALTLAATAVDAQPPNCGVAPTGQPWGCELSPDHPPAIRPVGDVLDTQLVIREKDLYVPVWT